MPLSDVVPLVGGHALSTASLAGCYEQGRNLGIAQFLWLALLTAVPAGVVACASLFVVRRLAPRWGLIDRPNARKVHQVPTPLGGGIGVWLGVLVTLGCGCGVLVWQADRVAELGWLPDWVWQYAPGAQLQVQRLAWIAACGTALMILGLIDDKRGVPWQLRLLCEFAIATVAVLGAKISLTAFISWPLVPTIMSVFWVVTLINVFNMLDNMDGLSGGVATIVSVTLAAAMWMTPDPGTNRPQVFVAAMLLVMAGSLVGFLWHNFTPSRIFLGDAGAYFVGFYLAMASLLATFTSYEENRRIPSSCRCVRWHCRYTT